LEAATDCEPHRVTSFDAVHWLGYAAPTAQKRETMSADRRQNERFPAELSVRIRTKEGKELRGRSADLSLGGMFVVMDPALPTEEDIQLTIESQGESITARGLVVHSLAHYGVGVQFTARDEELERWLQRAIKRLRAALA
jgi:c-di-GMP-binding flagellar brake protein YcgR